MTAEEKNIKQKELIETLGKTFDKQGFGLIPGRILGLLMVSDKEQFYFEEIVDELKISKSTASHALRILEARNSIEYTTAPGTRKRYFHIRRLDRFAIINDHHEKLKTALGFVQAILELKENKESPNAVFMREMSNLTEIFLQKFKELKAEYYDNK